MLLVNTEDHSFIEAIGLLEKLGQVPSDGPGTLAQRYFALKLRCLVLLFGYDTTITVTCARIRTPASYIVAGHDAVHMVRCQEAVINALAEAVGVDGIAEVAVGIDIVNALRSCGHAKLIGRFKVIQYLTPVAVIGCTTAMAFIDDHQVKEVGSILAIETRAVRIFSDSLVDSEVYFTRCVDLSFFYLVDSFFIESGKFPDFGVIDKDVTVRKVEYVRFTILTFAVPMRMPQLPTNLEGDKCLACTCCHREQNAFLTLEDGFQRFIDGDHLVVARYFITDI